MKPFLREIAEKVVAGNEKLEDLTFIFPNRRAALYFQSHLSQILTKPKWAPRLHSIEEFFKQHSTLNEPDRLTLIHRLYKVYKKTLGIDEPFDRFYFWGEMLLRDFDEIDKYMVNASQLFTDLSKMKELDDTFDYLTEEQKKFLESFWMHFAEKQSVTKDEFLRLWKKLAKVYTEFTKDLRKDGLGYEGMIHREVAEKWKKKAPVLKNVIFAGFNALTKAEAVVISELVGQGARVFWDTDAYYVNNKIQEAGRFMRQYKEHTLLGSTFEETDPNSILGSPKNIELTGVAQRIGQAKLAGEIIRKLLPTLPKENLALELSKTVIVLPDEAMLLPVMHSMPEELEDINVTMGYPLRETPMFGLLDIIVEMHVKARKDAFNHREVVAVLGHAYVIGVAPAEAQGMKDEVIGRNRVFVDARDLKGEHPIFEMIFRMVEPSAAAQYLLDLVQYLGASFKDKKSFDREFAYHFYQHLSRLISIMEEDVSNFPDAPVDVPAVPVSAKVDWRGFQKLFRQVLVSQRIPFTGEPLRGLQIMGVLETRNLDFENVIFLSLNEGQLPAAGGQTSYLPFALRKAYGLPTHEHRDATYAYLFYRLLQRSKDVHYFYNTEPDIIGNGEMSRFLYQILLESGLKVKRSILHNPVHVQLAGAIEIPKTDAVLQQLDKYVVQSEPSDIRGLSPSSLNDYIDCGLRFYLKNVVRLTEATEVDEDVDARVFGNIIHEVICWFYESIGEKKDGLVEWSDLQNPEETVQQLIDRSFRKLYKLEKDAPVHYAGQWIVVREITMAFVLKIIAQDRYYAPFTILMLEEPFAYDIGLSNKKKVRIGGRIDRADLKDGIVRVIDYKTGKVDEKIKSVESLFARDVKRNNAALQTFLYAQVYYQRMGEKEEAIIPGLIAKTNLYGQRSGSFGHSLDGAPVKDARPHLREFGERLHDTVEEMFNPEVPFRQTSNLQACTFCAYRLMCRR